MAYETRDNSGALFKNSRKEKDTHPDYTGDAMVNGRKMRLSAWLKTSKNGNKFMSLAFSEPQERQPGEESRGAAPTDDGSDIPF